MTANFVRKASLQQLTDAGFDLICGYSAFKVCIRYKGNHIGTFDVKRAYAFPRLQIIDALELE